MTAIDPTDERRASDVAIADVVRAARSSPPRLHTGSELDRLAACPPSGVGAQTREESAYASRGTALHRFLQRCNEVGRAEALAEITDPAHHDACEALDLDELPTDAAGYVAEVSFAWNYVTGVARLLGTGLERKYIENGVDPSCEVALTIDVLGLTTDGSGVIVYDYKTGLRAVSASKTWQLLLGAMCACQVYGRSLARVTLLYIRSDASVYHDRAELDPFALMTGPEDLRTILARVAEADALEADGGEPSLSVGDWCKYCPRRRSCRAQAGLIRMVTDEFWASRVKAEITDETIAQAWRLVKRGQKALDDVEATLKALATVTPVDLGDGLVLGPRPSSRRALDGERARKALAATFDQRAADEASEWTVTISSVKRAVRRIAQERGEKITRVETKAMEAIAAEGGIVTKLSAPVTEWRPPKEE